jgi:predicted lipid-binding transport protein (Tim44 family)
MPEEVKVPRPKPGRPPLDKTDRVREIMRERRCSYGTAYAQFRREREARGAEYAVRYPYLDLRQCYILKLADEIRQIIADHEQDAIDNPKDPVQAAREHLAMVKQKWQLGDYGDGADAKAAYAADVREAAAAYAKAREEAGDDQGDGRVA